MAKPTAPLLSFGASGAIAKSMVFSKWKGRPYVRRHVIPANPQTTAQTGTRTRFTVANNIWKVAPALFIAPWTRFATGQVLTDRNAFIGHYVHDLKVAADMSTMVFSPGAKGGLPALSIILTPGDTTINVAVTNPDEPTDWTLASAIAAAIPNEDPTDTVLYNMVAAEDAVTQNDIDLDGLTNLQEYVVGCWLKWTKPDGTVAYGASINDTATPTT